MSNTSLEAVTESLEALRKAGELDDGLPNVHLADVYAPGEVCGGDKPLGECPTAQEVLAKEVGARCVDCARDCEIVPQAGEQTPVRPRFLTFIKPEPKIIKIDRTSSRSRPIKISFVVEAGDTNQ